jgi:hypothetical protein
VANAQLLASDSFASGSLAAGWTELTGLSPCKVVVGTPNVTEPNALSTVAAQVWTGQAWPNDQSSEVVIQTLTAENSSLAVLFTRIQPGAYSGYQANIGNSSVSVYVVTAGSAVQIGLTTTGLTIAAGDVFTFQAAGCCLTIYQNGKFIFYGNDATYPTGAPGFGQYSTVNITHTQIAAWRGYNAIQQDGIWTKQGIVLPAIASELTAADQRGTQNLWIFQDSNPQILGGSLVYKMWFGSGQDTGYAESLDGITWTRYSGNPVITGVGITPCVVKVNGTYHFYGVAGTETGGLHHYTSPDGVTWTLVSANTFSGSGSSAGPFFFYVFNISAGVWYALYLSDLTETFPNSSSLATSADGATWTQYAGNPVASNWWGAAPVLRNGIWYGWGATANPNPQESSKPAIDPYETLRLQSVDMKVWTNPVHSIHHSQQYESLNRGNAGGYGGNIIDIGGRAYLYCGSESPDDGIVSLPPTYQIGLAIAPASIAQIITQSEDAVQIVAVENFASGAGNLDGNWTTPTGVTKLQIVSGNLVQASVLSTSCAQLYTGGEFSPSQYAEITIAALTATAAVVVPLVLGQTASYSGYYANIAGATGSLTSTCGIYKLVSGSATLIGPLVPATIEVGDVIRLSVIALAGVGNVLSVFQNGYLLEQVVDYASTFVTGFPGMGIFNGAASLADAEISLFAAGNANMIPIYPPISRRSTRSK